MTGDDLVGIEPGRPCHFFEILAVVHHGNLDHGMASPPILDRTRRRREVGHPRRHLSGRRTVDAEHQHRLGRWHDVDDPWHALGAQRGGPSCRRPGFDLDQSRQRPNLEDPHRARRSIIADSLHDRFMT